MSSTASVSVRIDKKTKKTISAIANKGKRDGLTQTEVIRRCVAITKALYEKGFYMGDLGFFLSEDKLPQFGKLFIDRTKDEERTAGTEDVVTDGDVVKFKELLTQK